MLGVQTARGSEPMADRADRKGGAAQHPEGGIAERRDARFCHVSRHLRYVALVELLIDHPACMMRIAMRA